MFFPHSLVLVNSPLWAVAAACAFSVGMVVGAVVGVVLAEVF